MKALRLLALSLPLFLCHSARQRVISLSLTTPLSSARATFSSSLAYWYWLLSVLSSCLCWVILTSRQFGIDAAVDILVARCSLLPNLTEPMLIMNMGRSLWCTPPLAIASRAASTSSSNCRHTDSLLAAGHKIRHSDVLLWGVACGAWRLVIINYS